MRLLEPPPEKRGGWRVEAEFIGAIRGEETVRLTDFASGVRYMEFTEAVAQRRTRSASNAASSQDINRPDSVWCVVGGR